MAFCTNCGNELPEGTKFCSNCGAQIGNAGNMTPANNVTSNFSQANSQQAQKIMPTNYQQPAYSAPINQKAEETLTGLDRYGKYFGIILLILAIIDMNTEPPIVTIFFSIVIIAGAIFCFGKKYKLKGFTIAAFILSAICLIFGVSQAKKYGLIRNQKPEEYVAESSKDEHKQNGNDNESAQKKTEPIDNIETSTEEVKSSKKDDVSHEKPASSDNTSTEAVQDKVEEVNKTEETNKSGGVDPDLKAFLDSYEDFVDEYVSFMKKYNKDPANAIAMLAEYSEIMQKYADFADKINKYDSQSMSTEDYKYYIEVTSRCSQKMLSVY